MMQTFHKRQVPQASHRTANLFKPKACPYSLMMTTEVENRFEASAITLASTCLDNRKHIPRMNTCQLYFWNFFYFITGNDRAICAHNLFPFANHGQMASLLATAMPHLGRDAGRKPALGFKYGLLLPLRMRNTWLGLPASGGTDNVFSHNFI